MLYCQVSLQKYMEQSILNSTIYKIIKIIDNSNYSNT